MQSLKQAVKNIGRNKYHQNLLGESLEDLCRKATNKHLDEVDELVNAQVCQAINDEQNLTPKDMVNILKKRLNTNNPHKQWLAILLVGKVLADCQAVIGMHTEELLTEVARIITKYSRFSRETPMGIRARNAARDLLRNSPAGLVAIRHVAREAYITPQAAFGGGGAGGAGVEKESLKDEVKRMIDCANNLAEVLNEMLVNNGEPDLLRELLNDLNELRTYFNVNLEQLMNFPGDDVESLTKHALEAMDALDNTLALQQDVLKQDQAFAAETAANSSAPAPQPTASLGPPPSTSTATPPTPAPAPVPAPASKPAAPAAPAPQRDLLDLLDFGDALPSATAAPAAPTASVQKQPEDPFANLVPLMPTSPASQPVSVPSPAAVPNSNFPQPPSNFTSQVGSPGMGSPMPQPGFSSPQPQTFNPNFPASPAPMGQPGGMPYAPQQTGYGGFSPSQPGYMMSPQGMYNSGYMPQQTGYGMGGYGAQPGAMQGFQSSSNNPFNAGTYGVQNTGSNPFGTSTTTGASVDQEFERIFADRSQGQAQQVFPSPQQQQQQQWRF